jgi:integrase
MYALKWSDIDLDSGLIKVTKQWTNKDGITATKTGDNRVVPISPDLHQFLIELKRKEAPKMIMSCPIGRNGQMGSKLRSSEIFAGLLGLLRIGSIPNSIRFLTRLFSAAEKHRVPPSTVMNQI